MISSARVASFGPSIIGTPPDDDDGIVWRGWEDGKICDVIAGARTQFLRIGWLGVSDGGHRTRQAKSSAAAWRRAAKDSSRSSLASFARHRAGIDSTP